MRETLSVFDLFALFHRAADATRELGVADSIEYLNVVTYLVTRNSKED